jgi:hypothetical protein
MTTETIATQALAWPETAQGVRVLDAATEAQASEYLLAIKALRVEVDAAFDPIIAAAFKAHREACAQKKRAEAPLVEAEGTIKRALADWSLEQDRRRQAEEIRLSVLALQDAEARQIAEAAELERQATATGNTALLDEAHAILDTPVEAPTVIVAKSAPTVGGISYRDTWSARIVSLPKLIAYVAAHPEHANLLTPNLPALNGLARSLKEGMRIDGVEAVKQRITAASGR